MPPHVKKSTNQAHLENGTYEQIVTHLERELELNSLECSDETQVNTATHKQQIEGNQDSAGKIKSNTNESNPKDNKNDRKSRTVYPPWETRGKTKHSAESCYVGANASNRPLPWTHFPSTTRRTGQYNRLCPGYSLTSLLEMPHFHSGTVTDSPRPKDEFSTNPICCLAATSGDICGEFKLGNTQNDPTAETNENTRTPQLKQRNDVESQTTSLKEISLQKPEPLRNSSEKMKLLANQYCASITTRIFKTKSKKRLTASQPKFDGDENISFLTKTTSTLFGKHL